VTGARARKLEAAFARAKRKGEVREISNLRSQISKGNFPAGEATAELEFRRGYYLAVANLMRLHGSEVEARDTLSNYGKFNPEGIEEYDLKVLRPLAKEIERLRK
jgi:hypothetical protein